MTNDVKLPLFTKASCKIDKSQEIYITIHGNYSRQQVGTVWIMVLILTAIKRLFISIIQSDIALDPLSIAPASIDYFVRQRFASDFLTGFREWEGILVWQPLTSQGGLVCGTCSDNDDDESEEGGGLRDDDEWWWWW